MLTHDDIYIVENESFATFTVTLPVASTAPYLEFIIRITTNTDSTQTIATLTIDQGASSGVVEYAWDTGETLIIDWRFDYISSNSQFTVDTRSRFGTYF